MLRRRWFRILAGVLLLSAGVLCLGWSRITGRHALAAFRQDLVSRGERLDLDELTPHHPPNALAASTALQQASYQLRGSEVPARFNSGQLPMRPVAPGKRVVTWQQPQISTQGDKPLPWETFTAEVANNQLTVERLHTLLQQPRLENALDYRAGFNMLLPHLASLRVPSQWLAANALVELHEGHPARAAASITAGIRLANALQGERLLISQLVRLSAANVAWALTWEALQAEGWTEETLQEWQAAWGNLEVLAPMEQALDMERAMGLALFDQLKSHPAQARQLLGGPLPAPPAMAGTGTNVLLDSLERASNWVEVRGGETATTLAATGWAWLLAPRDEMAFLELATPPIEALRKAGAGAPLAQVHTELKARLDRVRADLKQRPWICPIASMMSPSSGSAVAKAAVLEARRRLVITAIALRRYELAHRALPAGLQALVPGWLPALPIDPMDGKAIRYRRLDDRRFILYSVGLDGVDAGGEEAGPPSGANRSANLEHGDLLWPEAASAEEIGSAAQRRSRGRLP